jgi:hypothetical protein
MNPMLPPWNRSVDGRGVNMGAEQSKQSTSVGSPDAPTATRAVQVRVFRLVAIL